MVSNKNNIHNLAQLSSVKRILMITQWFLWIMCRFSNSQPYFSQPLAITTVLAWNMSKNCSRNKQLSTAVFFIQFTRYQYHLVDTDWNNKTTNIVHCSEHRCKTFCLFESVNLKRSQCLWESKCCASKWKTNMWDKLQNGWHSIYLGQ